MPTLQELNKKRKQNLNYQHDLLMTLGKVLLINYDSLPIHLRNKLINQVKRYNDAKIEYGNLKRQIDLLNSKSIT